MLKIKKLKIKGYKDYLIGFIIGISFISGVSYASTGTIGGLFEKISGQWKLDGTNIKDATIGTAQLGNDSVTTVKIVDKNVTEEKLADSIVTKLNSPIVTETDPLSVKLIGNQTIGGTKTFTNQVVGVNPTINSHLATKQYIDNAINTALSSIFTYSWNIGAWGACSVSCGGGTQTRSVICQRSDGITVSDSFCTGVKPVTSQVCNTGACSFWRPDVGGGQPTWNQSYNLGGGSGPNCGKKKTVTGLPLEAFTVKEYVKWYDHGFYYSTKTRTKLAGTTSYTSDSYCVHQGGQIKLYFY